jgi:hypothetical protein
MDSATVRRSEARRVQFLAEIPCFRELTGNFAFFRRPISAEFALRAAESGGISGKFPVGGTGNLKVRNREFSFAEQGIFCTEQGIQIAAWMVSQDVV